MKILNPVKYFQDKPLLLLNLFLMVIGVVIAIKSSVRFDGVLDLHFIPIANATKTVTDVLINVVTLSIVFFLFGRIVNPKTRLIDCLNVAFISRVPFYILSALNSTGQMYSWSNYLTNKLLKKQLDFSSSEITILILLALSGLAALILSVLLLFNGFKTATNAKTTKHYILFVVALIVSEIISAIILKNL